MATETRPRAGEIAEPLVLRMHPIVEMSDDQLLEFCSLNEELRIERTAGGDLEIMPPTGGETSNPKAGITARLWAWALRDGTGVALDSDGGFVLPNGAMRLDATWARRERLMELTAEQKKKFLPLCPDFVVELRSPSGQLETLQAKMREYVENGARLGWLIDSGPRRVHVYRLGREVERLDGTASVPGEPGLPGFVLDLRRIWEPGF